MDFKKNLIISLLFAIAGFNLFGQHLEFNTKGFFGLWNNAQTSYFYDGAAIELLYERPYKNAALRAGLEYRSIDWGNQVSINLGYVLTHISKDKWNLDGVISPGIGLALFRENPLFVYSISYMPEFIFAKNKRRNLTLGLGIRYTHSPAYKEYGNINQVLDFPLKIGVRFMGKKKS